MSRTHQAVVYARESQDSSAEREAVRRQVEACIEQIERTPDVELCTRFDGSPKDPDHPELGNWDAGVFVDNDRSARKGSKAKRPEYDRMMRHVLDLDVNTIYSAEQSRLWRNNRQASIALDDMHKLPITLRFIDGPEVRTDDFTGQFLAQVVGAAAALEANLAAQRQQKPIKIAAATGAYHGGLAFGFTLAHFNPDGVTTHPAPKSVAEGKSRRKSGFCEPCKGRASGEISKIRTLVPDVSQAEATRRAYDLIDSGLTPYEVLQYLDGHEIDGPDCTRIQRPAIKTANGKTWEEVGVGSLLTILRAHRNRGWREWRKGWDGGKRPPGELIKGNWDGIVPDELFFSVNRKLDVLHKQAVAKRYVHGPAGNKPAHLLTGRAFGGFCGHRLQSHPVRGKQRLRCWASKTTGQCVNFEESVAEIEVERQLFKWFATSGQLAKQLEHTGDTDLEKLRETRGNFEAQLKQLDVDYYAQTGPFERVTGGETRDRKYRRLTDHMSDEVDRLDSEIELHLDTRPAGKRGLGIPTGSAFRTFWRSADLQGKRAVIALFIDKVLIYPAGAGNKPDPRLVRLIPGSWYTGELPPAPDPASFASKGKILAFLREHQGEWFTREDTVTATGVSPTAAHKNLMMLGAAGEVAREWRRRGGQRACFMFSAASGASWGPRTRKAPDGAIGAREKVRFFLESDSNVKSWFTAAEIGAGSGAGSAPHVTRVVNELVTAGFAQRRMAPLPRRNVRYEYSINGR